MDIKEYASIFISIFTLVINIFFYIIIAPRINYRMKNKERMYNLCSEFLDYLITITSIDNFDGVPTKIRSYSIRLQLMFRDGKAPHELRETLEKVFQLAKKRKNITTDENINIWQEDMRSTTFELRVLLSKNGKKVRW
ncbi:MAG: type IV secretory system conjugative DNA transfer family protein [Vallitalea sp.]|jgi:hypothetical protein|nr:type IV secretory system conjugative DNA transfer family protein [Vallitalea sp.]